jgi:hypothetical protein
MHPLIEEILRVRRNEPIRGDVLRRWQDSLRNDIQPQLDELNDLKADPPKPEAKKGRAA